MIHCCSDPHKILPLCCFEKACHLWHQFPRGGPRVRCRRLRVRLCIWIFVVCVSVFSRMLWVRRPTHGGKSMRVAVATEFLPPHVMWRSASVVTYYVPFSLSLSAAMQPTAHLFQLCSVNLWTSRSQWWVGIYVWSARLVYTLRKYGIETTLTQKLLVKFTDNYKKYAELNLTFWNGVFL